MHLRYENVLVLFMGDCPLEGVRMKGNYPVGAQLVLITAEIPPRIGLLRGLLGLFGDIQRLL